MMNSFYLKNTRSVLFSMLLSLLMCVVGASKASAGNVVPRNPIVRIDNGPTYSDNGTEVTLKLWMYNYDGDNAWFIGDVYLTIDGVKVCKLNDMWNKIANVSNEKDIKSYQNSGNVGSQGTIMLNGVNVGTAQFRNAKKDQTCKYNSNMTETKWTTIDLKLSFNNSFAYILHKINVEGKWRDRCDNKNMADKNWNIENTINGYVYPSDFKIERRGWNFELSWIKQKHNTYVKSDGKWVLYKHLDDTSVKVAEIQSTANIRYIEIPLKDFSCNATYYITFVPSTFTEAETICGLTTSASKGGHSIRDDGLCKNCEHSFLQYQTTDGKIVSFNGNKNFGANILSHTVDKTGNCVIEFDGPITTIPNLAFYKKNLCNSISIPSTIKSIGECAFSNCKLSGKLTIPNSVNKIGSNAFSDCSGLTGDLIIPNSVTEIGNYAFSGCSGFNGKLSLSNNLINIGTHTFFKCSGFTGTLTIPNSVTKIGEFTFYNCEGLTGDLIIPNSVTEIGTFAFNGCSGFNGKLTLSNNLAKIGSNAFYNCSSFTGALTIPNSVTEIGSYAFYNCSGFNGKLTLSNKLAKIGTYSFRYCTGFTGDLIIPNSVTEIAEGAFRDCTGFNGKLILSNNLKKLGYYAFSGIKILANKQLVLPATLEEIEESAFMDRKIQSFKFLSLPKGLNFIQGFSKIPKYVSLSDASYISELTDGKVKRASYSRTMSNTWGTLVLPYNLKLTGDEPYSLYAIDHIASDEIVLRSLEGEVTAGTPCIVKRKGEQTELTFVAENASINVTTNTDEVGDLNFMGTYWAKELTNGYIIRKDKFWNVAKLKESSPNIKALMVGPFRSWLEGAAPNGAAQLSLPIDNPTTSIDNIAPLETLNADNVEYYDLNGKRLAAPMKGVNIVKRGNKTMKVIIK